MKMWDMLLGLKNKLLLATSDQQYYFIMIK